MAALEDVDVQEQRSIMAHIFKRYLEKATHRHHLVDRGPNCHTLRSRAKDDDVVAVAEQMFDSKLMLSLYERMLDLRIEDIIHEV